MDLSIGVGDLARFVHRRGDIDDRTEESTTTREGIESQKEYQKERASETDSYETEVGVVEEFNYGDLVLTVTGRIDGIAVEHELDGTKHVVEEIKTTRRKTADIPNSDRSVHEAQLRLYAAMYSARDKSCAIRSRLTYVHPDSGKYVVSEHEETAEDLEQFLNDTVTLYCEWVARVVERVKVRNENAAEQEFPFEQPNRNQLQLARLGFVSIRDSTNLLMEAPTGTGKTIATAFPAVKTLGEEALDRVVFITARTTGQKAAVDAFAELRKQNSSLVQVTVSAKERVCLTPGAACRPEECEYAKGHYDRVRDATANLLKKGLVHRMAIENVAKATRVCPFELSLDVAEWADVVVCDYNYVFDPLIQLKRLHTELFPRSALLIDEAHRLTERVREMLSCEFDLDFMQNATAEAIDTPIHSMLSSISRELEAFFNAELPREGELVAESSNLPFIEAVKSLFKSDRVRSVNTTDLDLLSEWLFQLFRYRTIEEIREGSPSKFMWLLTRTAEKRTVQLRCLGADSWIKEVVGRFHGSIRFSGTLSPGQLFNEEHGLDGPVKYARLPVDSNRLGVFVVPHISTYYKQRERTSPKLAALLNGIAQTAIGNWLVAFPSFAYMNQVVDQMPASGSILVQKSGMNLDERDEFVKSLTLDAKQLAFVVMGGVFTESIDIEQTALEGVVIVSPALPPRSHELERIRTLSESGYEIAYRRPAMTRVIQAAGRVMRGEFDRGMVVLIDPRFTEPEFTLYFPSHWEPEVVAPDELMPRIQVFQSLGNSIPMQTTHS